MALVEETARYLDGKGREESRDLPRKAAMLYAGESMRVTTRLMQAASWLLVQRAVHEGDMEPEAARQRTLSAGLQGNLPGRGADGIELLPRMLRDLLERSDNLYRRIARLDDVLFGGAARAPACSADQPPGTGLRRRSKTACLRQKKKFDCHHPVFSIEYASNPMAHPHAGQTRHPTSTCLRACSPPELSAASA